MFERNFSRRQAAIAVWRAGVEAVHPTRLIRRTLSCRSSETETSIRFHDPFDALNGSGRSFEEELAPGGRLIVVGFGKASGEMAAALEEALAPLVGAGRVTGWVNVPADGVRPLKAVHLHAGRPAGRNEPTADGVFGSERIVELLHAATPDDLIIALISGGGSALLPLPALGVSLEEKGSVTRFLSGAGANIVELNTVRGSLSRLKAGRMRELCRKKRLVSLILSDVLGNRLETIAGGPTVPSKATDADALGVLKKYRADRESELAGVVRYLQNRAAESSAPFLNFSSDGRDESEFARHRTLLLGDNASAVRAASLAPLDLQFSERVLESAASLEGRAEEVGRALLEKARNLARRSPNHSDFPVEIISGGEPVVELVAPERRGKGGRNTQLVLAALIEALRRPDPADDGIVFLSAGTDGEDGPTTCAGAFFDAEILRRVRALSAAGELDPEDYLARNDACSFFEKCGGLFCTGPTGTNVCDLRVILI